MPLSLMISMSLPTREEAQKVLEEHVTDEYQRYHAKMVAVCMDGYAKKYDEDPDLWYIAGLLHDVDFEQHPDKHPGESLKWFKEWGYPEELIHAVEAHAYGYNGFETEPNSRLAAGLLACDEICGIFYSYQKLNPIPFVQIKAKSIKKRLKEKTFAAKVDREVIQRGCDALELDMGDHAANLVEFLSVLDE